MQTKHLFIRYRCKVQNLISGLQLGYCHHILATYACNANAVKQKLLHTFKVQQTSIFPDVEILLESVEFLPFG